MVFVINSALLLYYVTSVELHYEEATKWVRRSHVAGIRCICKGQRVFVIFIKISTPVNLFSHGDIIETLSVTSVVYN